MRTDLKVKNIIFLGRKSGAAAALEYLMALGVKVKLAVGQENENCKFTLRQAAENNRIPFFADDSKLYEFIAGKDVLIKDIDLVVSFLFWKKIKTPLIRLGRLGCVNFHPAPLPEYRGRAGYNTAILDNKKNFGVSAHYIDSEEFDRGPIIKVSRFWIDSEKETAFSLEARSQIELLKLFKLVMDDFIAGKKNKVKKNIGGTFLNKEQLESLKSIDVINDSLEIINCKIRAFFFPPYSGAKIKIKDQEFTLINQEILDYINKLINRYE